MDSQNGFSAETSVTTTKASTIGVDVTMEASFEIPEIVDVSTSFTTSTSITNTNSKSNTAKYDGVQKTTLEFDVKEGRDCHATIKTQSCSQEATGTVKYLASGFVWFNYDDRTRDHYKCMGSPLYDGNLN
ncbi:hypothetical protein VKT23_013793 [Stygiomarasmius scandens]|uniref:Uncharacterized protein n=1 Tax=Marasmiellus scandens TaxID=2682957 RepID=A0ABR1J546_9AGAR